MEWQVALWLAYGLGIGVITFALWQREGVSANAFVFALTWPIVVLILIPLAATLDATMRFDRHVRAEAERQRNRE